MSTKGRIEQYSWSNATPSPIILISGPEVFLADRATNRIRDILKESHAQLEQSDIDASQYVSGELITLASPSLFNDPRLIRVTNVEKCNDAFLEDALEYCQFPDSETTLIIQHSGGVRGKKLLETLRSGSLPAIEVVCPEIKSDKDKFEFATNEFKLANKSITPSALRTLVQAFSSSATELANACQQLIADSMADITDRTVEDYYGGRVETTAFKVVDLAVTGRHGDALVALRNALNSGADPVPVVAAFASKLRLMAKLYGRRGSSGELAGQLGAAPWQIDRAKKDLQGWSEKGLGTAIETIAQTDSMVKGASKDSVYALESMVSVVSRYGSRV